MESDDPRLLEALEYAKTDPCQLTVDDCIRIAESDGFNVDTRGSRVVRRNGKERKTVKTSALQKARQRAAAVALADGKVVIRNQCVYCHSPGVYQDVNQKDEVTCTACGRLMPIRDVKADRQKRIKAFIEQGIDIPLGRRATSK